MIGQSIHDDVVGNNAEWVDLLHEHVGRDHVKVDVLEEAAKHLVKLRAIGGVAVLLAPHQCSLEDNIHKDSLESWLDNVLLLCPH